MKSDLAKVLHPVCGVPMLTYPVAAARAAGAEKIVVVIGHQAGQIRELFAGQGLIFAEQREQLGTGHAVFQAAEAFQDYDGTDRHPLRRCPADPAGDGAGLCMTVTGRKGRWSRF